LVLNAAVTVIASFHSFLDADSAVPLLGPALALVMRGLRTNTSTKAAAKALKALCVAKECEAGMQALVLQGLALTRPNRTLTQVF